MDRLLYLILHGMTPHSRKKVGDETEKRVLYIPASLGAV